jgi:hypothetical protein
VEPRSGAQGDCRRPAAQVTTGEERISVAFAFRRKDDGTA